MAAKGGRAILMVLAVSSTWLACSDDPQSSEALMGTAANQPGGPGSSAGSNDEAELEDLLELTIDGLMLPLEPDPFTASVAFEDYTNAGFTADVRPLDGMPRATVTVVVTLNGESVGAYALRNNSDFRSTTGRAGFIEITDVDRTSFDSIEGSAAIDTLVHNSRPEGGVTLGTLAGSFQGTFMDGDGNEMLAAGRFVYD